MKSFFINHMNKTPWQTLLSFVVLVALAIVLTMCFNITGVDQPSTASAGERISITLDVEVLDDPFNDNPGVGGSIFIFGFLVPKSWDAAENTAVSISSTPFSTTLNVLDPDAIEAAFTNSPWVELLETKGGIGENYGEVEWVVFKADEAYNPPADVLPLSGIVNIETTVGAENMITQLGYFIGDAEFGPRDINMNFDFFFTPCMEVVNGEGETINLCGEPPAPATVTVNPGTFVLNDILNLTFDASKGEGDDPTVLFGASSVFLCATAHYEGGSMEVCDNRPATEFEFKGDEIWELTIWPPSLFDIPNDKEIIEITYNLKNSNGTRIVKNLTTNEDFRMEANCN
ncbi:MAG TPA: DUF4961 domain-containing protein [Cyclobacteriaceae bacterium]